MFSFHKSDVRSPTRQSSIDSSITVSYASDPVSESHGTPREVHEQPQTAYSSKRTSVFTLRSRSNTAASTAPSLLSLSHPEMAEHEPAVHDSTPSLRHVGSMSQIEPSGSVSKRSLFRGKKGKRLSETVPSSIDASHYKDVGKRSSVLHKGRRPHESSANSIRNRISSPFDFQHLTHTDRDQFAALENISSDKLAEDFSAARASQIPARALTGIRANNLNSRHYSTESVGTDYHPPYTSGFVDNWQQQLDASPHIEPSQHSLRLVRSAESFSQPNFRSTRHGHSQSAVYSPRFAPPRPQQSNKEVTVSASETSTPNSSTFARSKRQSGIWDIYSLDAAVTPDQSPAIPEDSYFGHALTTPDDSAIHAMTPPFSPSLEDVDEEPERFVSPRPAPPPPNRTPTSPSFDTFSFGARPKATSRASSSSHISPKTSRGMMTRPISQMSDTLGSAGLVRRASVRRRPSIRGRSNTWRAIEESWEDDIDYIYENALEADCDSEWDRTSVDGLHESESTDVGGLRRADSYANPYHIASPLQTTYVDYDRPQPQFEPNDFRTSLLVPSVSNLPDLVPTSAISTSTSSTGLTTPADTFSTSRFNADEGFVLSPSLLVPQEYKETEVSYEDLLQEYEGSDRHFPMLDASQSIISSARSSHARSSRRSSYDSSLVSSAQSSGLWSSPVRRSASSAGSIPDLIPSRRARKDVSFSLVVDQLSEQVANLRHFDEDEEDDDITPPGRTLEGRTFFTVNEQPKIDSSNLSIEDELKASLELARHGSQRQSNVDESPRKPTASLSRQGSQQSTRGPSRRKQALSDGAAKLLSATTASEKGDFTGARSRSATDLNPRSPMLNLFPTPPRHISPATQL